MSKECKPSTFLTDNSGIPNQVFSGTEGQGQLKKLYTFFNFFYSVQSGNNIDSGNIKNKKCLLIVPVHCEIEGQSLG